MEINIEHLDKIKPQELNKLAESHAKTFQQDHLKTHQLRNVFSSIEKMRTIAKGAKKGKTYEAIESDLILLKPKVAYAAGRQKSVRFHFFPFVEAAIDAVVNANDKEKALKNFFALMESVVGYHKFFETA